MGAGADCREDEGLSLKPVFVGQFQYVEWTPDAHLRHSRFIALREDRDPKEVHREP
jgi:bifunctional non-homologous end joining protein LigD